VEDSRLVLLNARAAADLGADIRTRIRCVGGEPAQGCWQVTLEDTETGASQTVSAKALVNAAGPWVVDVIRNRLNQHSTGKVRLVRGSHIVVPKLFDHDRAYIFQSSDGRVVFAIPYEQDFTLIGTTDQDHEGAPEEAVCSPEETAYLCQVVSDYFKKPVAPADVVWTYSGVRPLFDDGAKKAAAATRDYVLQMEHGLGEPPLLNIFGGKITTYRRLAEAALAKLAPALPGVGEAWTAGKALPGGDFPVDGASDLATDLLRDYPFMSERWAARLVRAYGADAWSILGQAKQAEDLGRCFGWDLTEAEVCWLMAREWARTTDDVLWRRSKLGLRLTKCEQEALAAFMAAGSINQPIC